MATAAGGQFPLPTRWERLAKVPLPDVFGEREPGVDTRQLMFEADGFFRVHQGQPREGQRCSVDLIAGARYNKVKCRAAS